VQSKKELMQFEFDLNSRLESMKQNTNNKIEAMREDRRDNRVNMQSDAQMKMIEQRKQGDSLNNFESSGNDILSGDAGIEQFDL